MLAEDVATLPLRLGPAGGNTVRFEVMFGMMPLWLGRGVGIVVAFIGLGERPVWLASGATVELRNVEEIGKVEFPVEMGPAPVRLWEAMDDIDALAGSADEIPVRVAAAKDDSVPLLDGSILEAVPLLVAAGGKPVPVGRAVPGEVPLAMVKVVFVGGTGVALLAVDSSLAERVVFAEATGPAAEALPGEEETAPVDEITTADVFIGNGGAIVVALAADGIGVVIRPEGLLVKDTLPVCPGDTLMLPFPIVMFGGSTPLVSGRGLLRVVIGTGRPVPDSTIDDEAAADGDGVTDAAGRLVKRKLDGAGIGVS